jgi:hypothetical protein
VRSSARAWIAALAVASSLTLVVAPVAAARPVARTSRRHARHLVRWKAPSTASLVRAVTRAHGRKARIRAVEHALGALGVGVYTGSGKQVVGGFERNAKGIYLYDFEVQLIADQLAGKRLASFDQVATQLAKDGMRLGGATVTGTTLAAAVAKGVRRLGRGRARRTPAGALAAVVRKLGQARHVDLIHAPASDKPVLDPLQRMLVGIDATRRATGQAGPARAAAAATAGPLAAAAGTGCGADNVGGAVSYARGIGTMVQTEGASGGPGIILQEIKDGIDGMAMAYSVGIKAVKTNVGGAFGVAGPRSAKPVDFQVEVVMRDDYSHGKPTCGRLAGYKMPRKGGIPGVPIVWTRDAQGHLTYLGETPSCGTVCVTHTDRRGIATMTFQPDDEYLPNVGPKVYESGATTADELAQVAQGNILGSIAQAIGFTKEAAIRWEVSYHHPAGYRVDLPAQTYDIGGGATVRWEEQSLEVCLTPSSIEVPHPLKPYWRGPLAPGEPQPEPGSGDAPLGFQGTWSGQPVPTQNHPSPYWGDLKETVTAGGHSTVTDWTPLSIPIGFDTTKQYDDNNVRSQALWSFTSPTMHAHMTLTYEVPWGQTHTFDEPIAQAQHCPSALG